MSTPAFSACQAEVAFAYERVRFFRQHLEAAGLTPADVRTPADLRRVPPTSKVHYRRHFPAGVLASGTTLADRFVHRSQSSGTGGERLLTATHSFVLADRMDKTLGVAPALRAYLLGLPRRRTCRFAAPNCSDVECATPTSTIADRTLADGTLVLPVHHDLFATPPVMVERAVEELHAYAPHWLYVDPTHLAFLVRALAARGLGPPEVGGVVLTYTATTGVARRQLEAAFPPGVPLLELVSMSEFGWVALECPRGNHHLNDASYFVELIVGDRAAEPGELAELVLTSLGDRLSPHIRYRTGDLYRAATTPCPCGHSFPTVVPEGRAGNVLTREGRALLTPRGLDARVGRAPWLDAYQVHQAGERQFELRLVVNEAFAPHLADELASSLREVLGHDAALRVETTGYVASERSGKFAACTTALGGLA